MLESTDTFMDSNTQGVNHKEPSRTGRSDYKKWCHLDKIGTQLLINVRKGYLFSERRAIWSP